MKRIMTHLRGVLIALVALALSAGLAFGAQPEASGWGLSNASEKAGKTVPVKAGQAEDTDEDTTDEDEPTEDVEDTEDASEEGGENCSTDPTALTPEELAEMRHGSVVCWAAHQTEWPEWFTKHGDFVKCWAHSGKADAPSCTEDPNAEEPTGEEPTLDATGGGHGNGKGKGKKPDRD